MTQGLLVVEVDGRVRDALRGARREACGRPCHRR